MDVSVGSGLSARRVLAGGHKVCFLAVGKMLEPARGAATLLAAEGILAPDQVEPEVQACRARLAARYGKRVTTT